MNSEKYLLKLLILIQNRVLNGSSLDIIDQRNWMIGWKRAIQMTVGDFPEHLLVAVSA